MHASVGTTRVHNYRRLQAWRFWRLPRRRRSWPRTSRRRRRSPGGRGPRGRRRGSPPGEGRAWTWGRPGRCAARRRPSTTRSLAPGPHRLCSSGSPADGGSLSPTGGARLSEGLEPEPHLWTRLHRHRVSQVVTLVFSFQRRGT